jgi:hypothetical protein
VHRVCRLPRRGAVRRGLCPVDCCVPDPNICEEEVVLYVRAKRLHPDRADDLVLSEATSRFRN